MNPTPSPARRNTPSVPITDPRFQYRDHAHTDVRLTWARFGWRPIHRHGEQR